MGGHEGTCTARSVTQPETGGGSDPGSNRGLLGVQTSACTYTSRDGTAGHMASSLTPPRPQTQEECVPLGVTGAATSLGDRDVLAPS